MITQQQLLALDELVDSFLDKLRDYREQELDTYADGMLKEIAPRSPDELEKARITFRESAVKRFVEKRSCTVYLDGGRRIESDRFSGIFHHPHTSQETAQGFRYHYRTGDIQITVEFSPSTYDRTLDVTVGGPDSTDLVQEIFGALQNWAEDVRPPMWLSRWRRISGWTGPFIIGWGTGGFVGGLLAIFSPDTTYKFKEEAHRLLAGGINAGNQNRAIELLLAITSGYAPTQRGQFNPTYWVYYALGLVILVMIWLCPRDTIGIWQGRKALERWRKWTTIASVTIPTLFASTVIWPRILRLLHLS